MGVGLMAKPRAKGSAKRATGKPAASARKPVAVTLKGDPAWKEWLEGLAEHCRLDVSKAIDRALIQMAKTEGYEKEAPPR